MPKNLRAWLRQRFNPVTTGDESLEDVRPHPAGPSVVSDLAQFLWVAAVMSVPVAAMTGKSILGGVMIALAFVFAWELLSVLSAIEMNLRVIALPSDKDTSE